MSIKANDFGRVADRIHIMPDTSVTLQACGGGMGAKTGLYLLPIVVQACGDRDNMAMQGVSAVVYVDTTHADDVVRTDDIVAPLQERDYKGGKLIVYAIQGSIGGSDAGALVGMNPWSSPLQVYLDKKGISEEKETNEAMRLGTDLEDYDYMEDDLHCLDEDYDDDDDEEIMRQYRKDLL